MKLKQLFLLLSFCIPAFLFGQMDYENPKVYTIGGIEVDGCPTYRKNSIILHSGLSLGQEIAIPGADISQAIKKLWDQHVFADVEISIDNILDDKVFLMIKVSERPKISGYDFSKNITKSQEEDLEDKLGFLRGAMWTPEKEKRSTRIIENYFVEKSFFNTKVNFILADDTMSKGKNNKIVKIIVDKGERFKVEKIKIDGNQDFSDKRLKTKMKEVKEKRWWRIWAKSKYLPKKMEESKSNLLAFYRANGYRDAEIISDTVFMVDEKNLEVQVKVFEGNQYYIRSIAIEGNLKYSADSLLNMLGIEPGDVYDEQLLDRRLHGDATGNDLSGLYLDDGYLFFDVSPQEVAVENDSVDLVIRMFEGPQATIGNVIVEGNTKTSDYVILRELRTIPGRKFSRSDIIRSQREILNLGYFNQENLQIIPMPDPVKGTVDIKYIVEEKPSDQLQVQGGWGGRITDSRGNTIGGGFVGTVQLGFNNFSTKRFLQKSAWTPIPSGDGQKLNIAVQMNGVNWQNYSISFLEPWLGGRKPNSLGSSVYYTVTQSPTTGFKMQTIGGGLDFGMRMKWPDDFFRTYFSLNYKYYDIKNSTGGFGGLSFGDGFINILSGRVAVDRTSIDAPIFPRSGSSMNFSVEATPPYSLLQPGVNYSELSDADKFHFLEYHKWKFTGTWYYEIFKNLVIRPKVQFGYLGSYRSDYGISPFERFNLGGSGLQGYNFIGAEYIPLRGYPDAGSSVSVSPVGGGSIFHKYTLELRYPITLNQSAPIWVVGFGEAGNAWTGTSQYNPFDMKRSAGAGIRVMLPMVGLLGVDWGWGFDPVYGGNRPHGSQFTFILGQEF